DTPLATVTEWQNKCSEYFRQSNDGLLSLITKGFETMTVLLADESDRKHVLCALRTLESQRSVTMEFEESESDPLRVVAFGLVQSLHLTLHKMYDKIESLQTCKNSSVPTVTQCARPDKTPLPTTSQFNVKAEDILNNCEIPTFDAMIPKEEDMDDFQSIAATTNESTSITAVARNTPRAAANALEYTESDDSDDDFEPSPKLLKRTPQLGEGESGDAVQTVQKCLVYECEKYLESAASLTYHLYKEHNSLTLKKAGYCIICSCGYRVRSKSAVHRHDVQCLRKFTLHKLEVTPRCIFCNKYPKTASAYDDHLYREHESSLRKTGHYLICSCGDHIFHRGSAHRKRCDGRQFTIHELDGDGEPECLSQPKAEPI
ncbi:hypothetical protein PENTCL1PPCAC_7626, partial [Pristionchus entomophagus]